MKTSSGKRVLPFETEFKTWLEDAQAGFSVGKSANSDYRSRLKNFLINNYENLGISSDYFSEIPAFLKQGKAGKQVVVTLVSLCWNYCSDQYRTTKDRKWSNLKSAFSAYNIFLLELMEDEEWLKTVLQDISSKEMADDCKKVIDVISNKVSTTTFTQKELLDNFSLRLITQDRLWGNYNVFLPMRLIASIVAKGNKGTLRNWAKTFLGEKTNLIVSKDGGCISLNEVDSLSLSEGNVFVNCGKKKMPLFSKNSKGIIVPMKTSALKTIALDHDKPIYQILCDQQNVNQNNFPDLVKITSVYKQKQNGTARPKLKVKDLQNESVIQKINPNDLYCEVVRLHEEHVSFTLMDQVENIKKGKG